MHIYIFKYIYKYIYIYVHIWHYEWIWTWGIRRYVYGNREIWYNMITSHWTLYPISDKIPVFSVSSLFQLMKKKDLQLISEENRSNPPKHTRCLRSNAPMLGKKPPLLMADLWNTFQFLCQLDLVGVSCNIPRPNAEKKWQCTQIKG